MSKLMYLYMEELPRDPITLVIADSQGLIVKKICRTEAVPFDKAIKVMKEIKAAKGEA